MTETLTAAVTGISANNQDWLRLKAAATALQALQVQDGSIPETADAQGDSPPGQDEGYDQRQSQDLDYADELVE